MLSVTCSLDDGSLDDYRLSEVLARYEIETTFYLPVNWQRYLTAKGITPMNRAQAANISKRFTIGSHGVDHLLLTRVDPELQDREIIESRSLLQAMFKQPINSFCYPRGYYDQSIVEKVRAAGYKSARTVKVGSINPPENPFERETTVHIGYDRKEYGTDWLTYAKAQLERALEQAEDRPTRYHFWGHGAEITKLGQWDRAVKFIKDISYAAK